MKENNQIVAGATTENAIPEVKVVRPPMNIDISNVLAEAEKVAEMDEINLTGEEREEEQKEEMEVIEKQLKREPIEYIEVEFAYYGNFAVIDIRTGDSLFTDNAENVLNFLIGLSWYLKSK